MKIENSFLLGKKNYSYNYLDGNYSIDLTTGEITYNSSAPQCIAIYQEPLNGAEIVYWHVKLSQQVVGDHEIIALFWDSLHNYLGYSHIEIEENGGETEIKIQVRENSSYIALYSTDLEYIEEEKYIGLFNAIKPHYKQLKKRYAKENGQVFFRESLDGKISLFGNDYLLIKNALLEDTLYFYVYRGDNLFASASFNKSDCKFDHVRKGVELKLTYNDKYSKILDAYENTYDLIKLAPALTPITLTKRCVVQIYIQGEKTISNYAGGTYWETEVNEQVDDEDQLLRHYYFSKGPKFVEVDLQGFNYNINAAYRGLSDNNIWNATSKREVYGQVYKMPCSIKFNKVYNANAYAGAVNPGNVKLLSTGSGDGTYQVGDDAFYYRYDTYRIEIYTGRDGTGTKIYQSDYLYGKNGNFTLTVGEGLYPMSRIEQPTPQMDPTPQAFNLGEYVIEYQVWGRLLCDVDQVPSHEQGHESEMIDTYDLPRDDFATPRRNYRKCIGLRGFDSANSVVSIWQYEGTSESPTSYGMNDFGEYFVWPYTLYQQYFYPLARSSWANVSLWIKLGTTDITSFESYCAECYKEYSIKDTYHIGDAIKALLAKIDPSIKHEKTAEYSSFLYGHTGGTASVLGNCDLYITQKTNILKGEYDQAAQKAEIKFKQLMDMLRDCFRCFWYIDDQNRFRIEHVSYFMKGLSYNNPVVQFDLTTKKDKFNKKAALYCQQEIEYDKSDLISRYEFKYMDDVTKAMGGDLCIDVNNKYIKKDKTEEINIDGFTADIDYMLFLPDNFSNDGFALIMADSDKKVPIVNQQITDEKQDNHHFDVYVQNWYASFNQLCWHYMEDLSGNNIDFNNIDYLYVNHVRRCMKHDIEFPASELTIDVYKLIKTDIGNGYVEEVTTNIDTDMTDVELRYEPS